MAVLHVPLPGLLATPFHTPRPNALPPVKIPSPETTMATILIVDDSQFQRAFLKKALASDGHRFLEAENGQEGLHTAQEEQPDCILADLIMPETQGVGMLEGMREAGSLIPVIVVTADIQHHMREKCLALGARTVLHKPVDPETLRQTVTDILGTLP